jgi:23S rRNA (cytosine1962-C5)-methyltransferase
MQGVRFSEAFAHAVSRRERLSAAGQTNAYRLFDGAGDGVAGIYVDRYGPAAVLSVYDDSRWGSDAVTEAAQGVLEVLRAGGVESVYVKPYARDRSRLGGQAPDECTSPVPRAGTPQPEAITVEEYGAHYEVRLYDGFSMGLFLEHRDHRRALAERRAARVLNLFAYTCGFSVPLVASGAHVTNVDVSARYLAWGKRNHALNDLPEDRVRYRRMDAAAYLAYAARHADERFDLVIIDPPTFGAGSARRGVKPWKAIVDYPNVIRAAVRVLAPGGAIFAATNARELAADDALRRMAEAAVGSLRWESLPPWPDDVRERGRVAAVLFRPR